MGYCDFFLLELQKEVYLKPIRKLVILLNKIVGPTVNAVELIEVRDQIEEVLQQLEVRPCHLHLTSPGSVPNPIHDPEYAQSPPFCSERSPTWSIEVLLDVWI